MAKYNSKDIEIIREKKIGEEQYVDIVFQERNVLLDSLFGIGTDELKENSYAVYIKEQSLEICIVNKIDLQFNNAQIQIYKSNIPINLIDF